MMAKINLLTTGLATMCTESFGMGNIDFSWLVYNPSAILWADTIFLTKYMEESLYKRDGDPLDKSLNLIFEILEDNNVVKFKNSNSGKKGFTIMFSFIGIQSTIFWNSWGV